MKFLSWIPFFHLYRINLNRINLNRINFTQYHPIDLFILSNLRLEESHDSSEWNNPFLFQGNLFQEFLFHGFMLPD